MIDRRRLPFVVVVLALAARGAFADPPIDFEPAEAQRAFAVGDLADRKAVVDTVPDPVARAFAWLRDAYWRPVPAGDSRIRLDATDGDLLMAHARWLTQTDDRRSLPDPIAGTPDPLPILSALVLDRRLRESEGVHSTRKDGPLAAVAHIESVGWFLDQWSPGAYGGPSAIGDRALPDPSPGALARDAARNGWVALGAIGGLVLLAAMGGMLLSRPARRHDANGLGSNPPSGFDSPPGSRPAN